jgi:hypothetical protein
MLRSIARFFLLRFLPRRLLPILTLVEIVRMVRSLNRGRRQRFAVNDPLDSRTAPPPPAPGIPPG